MHFDVEMIARTPPSLLGGPRSRASTFGRAGPRPGSLFEFSTGYQTTMEKLGNRSNLTGVRRRTVETYAKEAEKRGDDKSPLGRLKRHPAPAYCTVLYCLDPSRASRHVFRTAPLGSR